MPNWLPIFVAGLFVAMVTHEAGHAIVGSLVGVPPRIINFGSGSPIWTGRWPRLLIIFRPILLNGHVVTLWRPKRLRLSKLAFALGGIIGNAIMFGVLAFFAMLWPRASWSCAVLGAAQAWVGLCAVVPWPTKVEGRRSGSDGLIFLRYLFSRRPDAFPEEYRKLLSKIDPEVAKQAVPSGDSSELMFAVGRYSAARQDWERRYWVDCVRHLIARNVLSDCEKLFVFEQLVSLELILRQGDITALEMDDWSMILATSLRHPGFRVTRGGALVLLGRAEEARELLAPLLIEEMGEINEIGYNIFLSQATASLGEVDASEAYASRARELANEERATRQIEMVEKMLGYRGQVSQNVVI